MIHQCNPLVPVATPLGDAMAHFLLDCGPEHQLRWICFLDNGECWTFLNTEVRLNTNITEGRRYITPFSKETLAHWADIAEAHRNANRSRTSTQYG